VVCGNWYGGEGGRGYYVGIDMDRSVVCACVACVGCGVRLWCVCVGT
jgi:hypothetical protein